MNINVLHIRAYSKNIVEKTTRSVHEAT